MKLQRLNIILATLVVVVGIIILALVQLFNNARSRIVSRYQSQQMVLAHQSMLGIESYLRERIRALEVLADFPASKRLEQDIYLTEYDRTLSKVGGFENIAFVDLALRAMHGVTRTGHGAAAFTRDSLLLASLHSEFAQADRERHALVTPMHMSEDSIRMVFIITPIVERNRTIGFIVGKIHVHSFIPQQVIPILTDFDGFLWILQEDGTVVYHSFHDKELTLNVQSPDDRCIGCHSSFATEKQILLSPSGSLRGTTKNPNLLTSFVKLSIPPLRWQIALSSSSPRIEQLIGSIGFDFMLLGVLILIAAVSFTFILVHETNRARKAESDLAVAREKSELESRYYSMIDNMPDGVFVLNGSKFVYVNEAMARLFQHPRDKFLDNVVTFHDLIAKDNLDNLQSAIQDVASPTGRSGILELRGTRADGKSIDLVLILYSGRSGDEILIQGIVRDVTEMRRLERERKQRENLVLIGEMGARLAHEIKNPLAGIQTGIQVLRGKFKDQREELDFCDRIIQEIQRMDKTIKSILYFAREYELHLSPTDLRQTVRDVVSLNAELLKQKQIDFRTQFDDDFPTLHVDEEKWKQIFWNLLNNSIQAIGSSGTIRVTFRRQGHTVRMTYGDSGPGIPETERNNIFRPFYSTRSQGNGLGLSITRSFVELHGGTIVATEPEHLGAMFIIELPIEAQP